MAPGLVLGRDHVGEEREHLRTRLLPTSEVIDSSAKDRGRADERRLRAITRDELCGLLRRTLAPQERAAPRPRAFFRLEACAQLRCERCARLGAREGAEDARRPREPGARAARADRLVGLGDWLDKLDGLAGERRESRELPLERAIRGGA